MERPIRSRTVFEGRVVRVRVEEVALPSGRTATREIVEHRGAVAMVPLTPAGEVLMVRQYRRALDAWLLELPAGTIEPGEDVTECLQRELAEEVGMQAGRIEHLITFFPSPGFLTERVHVYACTDLRPHRLAAEEEGLEVVPLPLAEARSRVDSGEIQDAKSVIGILLVAEGHGRSAPR
ncbi:MAG: NUDIX hydrolase [Armatimonadota bacterium]|nr:NUDIX hydrolase [Armatimonadota bacterium]MDR5697930.1 NUDIX hydrolase [Armatimonadota bacterium]